MYPYDEDNNLNSENNENNAKGENGSGSGEEGSYRMVRPDAGKSFDAKQDSAGSGPCYRDANYTSEDGASGGYYSPTPQRKEKESKPKKARRGMSAGAIVALCLVCALIGGCAGGAIAQGFSDGGGESSPTAQITQEPAPASGSPVANQSEGAMSARDIYYDLAVKQVVGISTEITGTNIWGMPVSGSVEGSGFVISEDGYILTNYHVIEDAKEGGYDITVKFSDDSGYETKEYTAEFVGGERNNDVAIIKIDASGLTPATLGDSDDLRVGDTVYAVGNPLGELNYSMSDGMVSATDRTITTSEGTSNMFQLTAAVNEGNSGGPVYNIYGQVVGIVTARPNEEGAQGIGFAIPIDDAVRIADDVINGGHQIDPGAEPAYLGVNVKDVEQSAVSYYGMPYGAYVYTVVDGGPAADAGIKVGDIITGVDGYDIYSRSDLQEELGYHAAGETSTVTVYRSGEYIDIEVTFAAAPAQTAESRLPALFG